jgi:RNA polymerase sigma-70 factor (ECF subfamily)
LRQRLESRDILQSTLLKAFEHGGERRAGQDAGGDTSASYMGWLVRIAENEIRDQAAFHGRQRRDAGQEVSLDKDPELAASLTARVRSVTSRLVWSEKAMRLERALESLEADHREVILLRRFEELSFPEIGRRQGRSPDACRMLFARAMTALTAAMESPEPSTGLEKTG